MAFMPLLKRHLATLPLLGAVAVCPVDARTNAGFTTSLEGGELIRRINNPEVGQLVVIQIRINRAKAAKGGLVRLLYDGDFFEYAGFQPVDFPSIPGPFPGQIETIQAFAPDPEPATESRESAKRLFTVEAGGTLLGDVTDDTGGGVFGRFFFRVLQVPGDEEKFISVLKVQINRTADDTDARNFRPGQFGLRFLQIFPNAITDVQIQSRDKSGIITWRTRDAGIDDTVIIDKVDADGTVISNVGTFKSPIKTRVNQDAIDAVERLETAGIDVLVADDNTIRDFLGIPKPPVGPDPIPALLAEAREAVKIVRERAHIVEVRGLEAGMRYRAKIRSIGFSGRSSPLFVRFFDTRSIGRVSRRAGVVDEQGDAEGFFVREPAVAEAALAVEHAVVGGKDDNGIVGPVVEGGEDAAEIAVDAADHAAEAAHTALEFVRGVVAEMPAASAFGFAQERGQGVEIRGIGIGWVGKDRVGVELVLVLGPDILAGVVVLGVGGIEADREAEGLAAALQIGDGLVAGQIGEMADIAIGLGDFVAVFGPVFVVV